MGRVAEGGGRAGAGGLCRVRRGTSSAGGGHASESPETSMETRMGVQFVPEALHGARRPSRSMQWSSAAAHFAADVLGPWDPIAFVNSL